MWCWVLDSDVEVVHFLLRRVCPDLGVNHALVYRLLWQVEPKSGEKIILDSGLARATVYKVLRELVDEGLVRRTSFKPVCYFAPSPVKVYERKLRSTVKLLERGRDKLKSIIDNSSSLGGEVYFIKRDGGQCRLIDSKTRHALNDEESLKEIKEVVDKKLLVIAESKQPRVWVQQRRLQ